MRRLPGVLLLLASLACTNAGKPAPEPRALGGSLLFVTSKEIRLAAPDGTVRTIGEHFLDAEGCTWTGDGRYAAWVRHTTGHGPVLYVHDVAAGRTGSWSGRRAQGDDLIGTATGFATTHHPTGAPPELVVIDPARLIAGAKPTVVRLPTRTGVLIGAEGDRLLLEQPKVGAAFTGGHSVVYDVTLAGRARPLFTNARDMSVYRAVFLPDGRLVHGAGDRINPDRSNQWVVVRDLTTGKELDVPPPVLPDANSGLGPLVAGADGRPVVTLYLHGRGGADLGSRAYVLDGDAWRQVAEGVDWAATGPTGAVAAIGTHQGTGRSPWTGGGWPTTSSARRGRRCRRDAPRRRRSPGAGPDGDRVRERRPAPNASPSATAAPPVPRGLLLYATAKGLSAVDAGGTVRRVVPGADPVGYAVSADGRYLAVIPDEPRFAVRVVDLATGDSEVWTPDDKLVAYAIGWAYDAFVMVGADEDGLLVQLVPATILAGGEPTYALLHGVTDGPLLTTSSDRIIVASGEGASARGGPETVYEADPDGATRRLFTDGDGLPEGEVRNHRHRRGGHHRRRQRLVYETERSSPSASWRSPSSSATSSPAASRRSLRRRWAATSLSPVDRSPPGRTAGRSRAITEDGQLHRSRCGRRRSCSTATAGPSRRGARGPPRARTAGSRRSRSAACCASTGQTGGDRRRVRDVVAR